VRTLTKGSEEGIWILRWRGQEGRPATIVTGLPSWPVVPLLSLKAMHSVARPSPQSSPLSQVQMTGTTQGLPKSSAGHTLDMLNLLFCR